MKVDLALPPDSDLGPVPAAEAKAVAEESCRRPRGSTAPIEVIWARRVRGIKQADRTIVMLVKGPAKSNGYYDQGIAVCQPASAMSSVRDTDWAKQPTQAQGLSLLSGSGFSEKGAAGKPVQAESWSVYRARPEIARIESRFVWKNGTGPWTKGVVEGGYAYTDSRVRSEAAIPGEPTEQLRAYDAKGNLIPVAPE
jgi:hypothetical protein